MNKIYIETYGCSANQNNSEIIAGILSKTGFLITQNEKLADIIIINSCVVKGKTESKIKRRIQDLKPWSNQKSHLLIIAGCMAETDWKKIKRINPNAVFLGINHIKDVLNLIKDWQENQLNEKKQQAYLSERFEEKLILPKVPQNKIISITQIAEGCSGNCSYCKTRLAKGNLRSYPQEDIVKSIENDLQNGVKEVWLTSQDNAAYGIDRSKKSELPELLKRILALKHRFKLRLGMANPNNILPILDELIEIYKNKKMFKFLHIPVQSASNSVLKHMNRYYTIEDAGKIIKKFRKEIPDITIATDIIVGYPTETEEDHKKNLEFIKNYKPDILNLSKFSSHKQTPAGKLKVLPKSIVRKRTKELMQLHRETARENKTKFLGKIIKVLVDKRVPNTEKLHQARDDNYNLVIVKCDKADLRKEIKVKITNLGLHTIIGEKI